MAAGFDENRVESRKAAAQARHRFQVDRGVLADRGMRTAAGLHPDDPLGREGLVADEELRVLLGVDVVGDRRDVVPVAQRPAKRQHERRLAGADGTADAYSQRALLLHDLKILEYWVSWRDESIASPRAKLPRSSSLIAAAPAASVAIRPPSESSIFWPSVCPPGPPFTPALTRFSRQLHTEARRAACGSIFHP